MGPKLSQCRINNSRVEADKIGEFDRFCKDVFGDSEKWPSELAKAINYVYWSIWARVYPEVDRSCPYKED